MRDVAGPGTALVHVDVEAEVSPVFHGGGLASYRPAGDDRIPEACTIGSPSAPTLVPSWARARRVIEQVRERPRPPTPTAVRITREASPQAASAE